MRIKLRSKQSSAVMIFVVACVIAIAAAYALSLREFIFEFYVDPYSYVNIATGLDAAAVEDIGVREPVFPIFLKIIGMAFRDNISAFRVVQGSLLLGMLLLIFSTQEGIFSNFFKVLLVCTVPAVFVLYSNLWRQFASILFVILAFRVGYSRRSSWWIFLIAVLLHISALVMVAAYYATKFLAVRGGGVHVVWLIILAVLVSSISYSFGSYSFLQEYEGDGEGSLVRRLYLLAILIFTLLSCDGSLLRNYAFVLSVLVLAIVPNPLFDRFSHGAIFLNYFAIATASKSRFYRLAWVPVIVVNLYILMQTQTAQRLILGYLLS
jgi:hypothetical protein